MVGISEDFTKLEAHIGLLERFLQPLFVFFLDDLDLCS